MLSKLKKDVLEANLLLPKLGLVTFTWGNVSGIDRKSGHIVIKPSGVEYKDMTIDDMVVLDMKGNIVEGNKNPSTDAPTHVYLYNQYTKLNGITHTHSIYATSWAQSGIDIPALGTTHADNFYGDIPCTDHLNEKQISDAYELDTGILIKETYIKRGLDPFSMPAILCNNHGPFTFGNSPKDSVEKAKVLEVVAEMALNTYKINNINNKISQTLLDKHYNRKHGPSAYYGQKK